MNKKIINLFQQLFNTPNGVIEFTPEVQKTFKLKYPNDFINKDMHKEFSYVLKNNYVKDIDNWSISFFQEGDKVSIELTHKLG